MMTLDVLQTKCDRALQRLTKWRTVFTGWQLGTRAKGDAESDAVRDHRELTILLRAEVSALTALLAEKGVFTQKEWLTHLAREAEELERAYQERFPGCKAVDDGLQIDVAVFQQTTRGWPQ